MKARSLLAALGVAAALVSSPALAQKETQPTKPAKPGEKYPSTPAKPAAKPGDDEMAQMMKAMQEAGTPGKNHEYMAQLAGDWDLVVKFRPAAEAPWQESRGTSAAHMWYEGRYLHESVNGEMMGMPFKGMAIMGFNNTTRQYESVWIDNMSTMLMTSTGTCDAAGKVFTMTSECADPMAGGQKKKTREVTTINGSDKHTTEFFEAGKDGNDFKSMEIVYTRSTPKADSDEKPGKSDREKHEKGEKDQGKN